MQHRKTAARLTAGLLLAATLVTPALAATGTVDTGSSVLRVRAAATTGSSILARLKNGTQVTVLDNTETGWYQISHNGVTGFVSADYLSVTEDAPSQDIPAETPAPVAEEAPVQAEAPAEEAQPLVVRVTASSLNIRSGPDTSYAKAGKLSAGRTVEVLEVLDGWYKIDGGYISAEYTVKVDPNAVSKGQEIVDYAMQFVGYPYVYGGSTPKGFDCSGFTKYVYAQFGYSLNRSAANQLDNGTSVSMSELQPGDLVLFKKAGTGSKRASHVGLYIGDGQFVHASTSKVGVIVSHMTDAYYTTGFVGGRRII